MKLHFFSLWVLLLILASSAAAEVRILADFYSRRDQAASVLKVQADLEAQRSNLLAHEAQKGWELFGGVSGGYQKSPFAREPFGHFFDPLARIGLRYPLLGSAERQRRAIEDAATQVKIEGIRLDWSRWLAALFLEENYAAYWSAQKMLVLTDAYIRLRHEGIERLLLKRQEAGLLFMSDYFEFLSAFDQAQRTQIEFSNNKNQALMRLTHLTDSVVAPFEAVKPPLGEIATTIVSDIEQPDLRILQAQIDHLQTIKETENWQGIDSDFSMTAFGGPAIPYPSPDAPQLGYGGSVGVNFRMPLGIISYRKNEQSRLNSQLTSLRADRTRRDQELQHEFQSLLSSYQQLTQQIKFQHTRLEAARELMRERYLRLQIMDGDVVEKYFQAINTYYRIAIENVTAESEHWKLHIRLRQFIVLPEAKGKGAHPETNVLTLVEPLQQVKQFLAGGGKPTNALVKQTRHPMLHTVQFVPDSFAAYVWNFNHTMTEPGFWTRKPADEVNRFLISMNARQIAEAVADPASLMKFLRDGRRHGKRIELLLGDPDWILPKYRKNLLQIISSLSAIDFDGLHLDIEPEQLVSQLTDVDRLKQFIETVRQVTAISPWPVGVSIHPRYLARKSSYGLCVPCKFAEVGVKEVAVMYYTMNIAKIVTTMKSAMQQHPNLIFSLAQSLEPELGPENSYAHKSQRYFNDAMQQLQNQLEAPNFGGLIIQSWLDLRNYLHENPL